jgi:hypothetical protein
MSTSRTIPPAFPLNKQGNYNSGINMRDYFAAHALQGMLACAAESSCTIDEFTEYAYRYADAMMQARESNE